MPRLLEATTDPAAYGEELRAILSSLGSLTGEAETAMIEILDEARAEILAQLALLDFDSPSRAMFNRALAGVDQTMANLAAKAGTTIADYQARGHALGVDLALKPLGGERGLEVLAAGVSLEQLQIMQAFSADLVQDISTQLRKRINTELTAIVVGAKSPTAAVRAIGRNLTSANHFSTISVRARAIVVTELGRAQALGTQGAQTALAQSLAQAGDPSVVRKRWLNAHLPGARPTHLDAESRYTPGNDPGPIPVEGFFTIGAFKAYYPRDPSLPPSESVNCHCVSITVIDEGSAQAAGNPQTVAAAKSGYSKAKATAAAPAVAATSKSLSGAAADFITDPYTSAGLAPVKQLKTGGLGYGGQIMAKKLGYSDPKKSGFIWDSTLGAWKHPKAPGGKQLPDFKDLAPLEQLGLMKAAGLSKTAQAKVIKHLDIDAPKGPVPYAATKPAAEPPPAPKPTPAAPAAAAPTARPRRGPSPDAEIKPAGTPGESVFSVEPPEFVRPMLDMVEERTGLPNPIFDAQDVIEGMKGHISETLGAALDAAVLEGRVTTEALEFILENSEDWVGGSLERGVTLGTRAANRLVGWWAVTSGDQRYVSLAIQRRAAELFDTIWPPPHLNLAEPYSGYGLQMSAGGSRPLSDLIDTFLDGADGGVRDAIDEFMVAQYDYTQETLNRLFPDQDTITMFRGISVATADPIYIPPRSLGAGNLRPADMELSPLSSFTLDEVGTAPSFGTHMIVAEVPKERILGSCLSGFGCLNEYEFVVLGAAKPDVVHYGHILQSDFDEFFGG